MNRKRINPAVWLPTRRATDALADMHPYEVRVTQASCVVTTRHYEQADALRECQLQRRAGRVAEVVKVHQEQL